MGMSAPQQMPGPSMNGSMNGAPGVPLGPASFKACSLFLPATYLIYAFFCQILCCLSLPFKCRVQKFKLCHILSAVPHLVNHAGPVAVHQPTDGQARERLQKQQRLLMFLRHCAKCKVTDCPYGNNCETGKQLWHHITSCRDQQCAYPRCVHARDLLRHYQKCRRHDCPICGPIKQVGVDGSGRTLSQPGGPPQNGVMPHDTNSNDAVAMVPPPVSPVQTNGVMVSAPSTSTMTNSHSRGATRVRDEAAQDIKEEDGHTHKRSKQQLDHIKVCSVR